MAPGSRGKGVHNEKFRGERRPGDEVETVSGGQVTFKWIPVANVKRTSHVRSPKEEVSRPE